MHEYTNGQKHEFFFTNLGLTIIVQDYKNIVSITFH